MHTRTSGHAFVALGRHGPLLLVLSLVTGMLVPPLAAVAHSILPISVFLLTLGSFLTAGLSPREHAVRWPLTLATAAWAGLGIPLLITGGLMLVHVGTDTRSGLLLSVLAPPVSSGAAIAAMLGLQPRLALIVSLVLTILSPLSMPLLAGMLGSDVTLNTFVIARRLAVIIATAGVIAAIALRWRPQTSWILPNAGAAAGVAVIGLVIIGLATTDGIRAAWHLDPALFLLYAATAISINITISLVSTSLFFVTGFRNACTIGLISGNRNVTLAWAAASGTLSMFTEAYVAACIIPTLSLPLIIKGCFALRDVIRARPLGAHSPRAEPARGPDRSPLAPQPGE